MKITNNHNLPEAYFNAVNNSYPPKAKRLSVTTLIGPPLIPRLLLKHWDSLQSDAVDKLWMLLGTAVDSVLTQNAPPEWITQEKLEIPVDGVVVVGKLDYFIPETGELGDWKCTSAWSYIFGGRAEWEKQLNCYAWMQRKKGREVKSLKAQRIFRDFQQRKATEPDYPSLPIMSLDIPLWSFERQEQYIQDQVEYHTQSKDPHCSAEDKWEKPTVFAIMKKGKKSAEKVTYYDNGEKKSITTQEKAEELMAKIDKPNLYIEKRLGECTRCKSYCSVRDVCPDNIYRESEATSD